MLALNVDNKLSNTRQITTKCTFLAFSRLYPQRAMTTEHNFDQLRVKRLAQEPKSGNLVIIGLDDPVIP